MSPDDPRHGTLAGFVAHTKHGVPACRPCLDAKMRYEKARLLAGGSLKVSALGTQRRIQALRALGYTLHEIATAAGWSCYGSLTYPLRHATITRATADRVARAYEQLCMTPPTGAKSHRIRLLAARQGWLPPLAWDDIDHDPEPAYVADTGTVDQVVIERILAGDSVPASIAERRVVVARWPETGRPYADLVRLTGWKVERYHQPAQEEAA